MIRRGERGATLVVVAAFALVAMLMAAAVIDIGGLRAEKKEVTLSTDAAALAAVSVIDYADPDAAGDGTSCGVVDSLDQDVGGVGLSPTVEDVARYYLTENGESIFGTCEIFFGATGKNQAYVTVTASDTVDYEFANAIGAEGGVVTGTSSARAGSASIGGVYPIGLCVVDELRLIVNNSEPFPQYFGGNEELRMDFGNSNCGGSGNHDQIDFLGNPPPGSCSAAGQFCFDLNSGGYDGPIPATIGSNPGGDWNPSSISDPLEDLRTRAVHVWIPSVGVASGNGTGATFPVQYLVEVVITGFRPTGNDKGLDFDVYQVVDYAYYQANGLPLTTVNDQVEAHICATTVDTSGCTTNPIPAPPPPPPPPPVACKVNSVTTSPTPVVDVDAQGRLTGALTVVAIQDVPADCGALSLEAVAGATVVPAPGEPAQSGSQVTFTFPAGTTLSKVNGTQFAMRISEASAVRHSARLVTVRAPTCSVSVMNPNGNTEIDYTRSGNSRTTDLAQDWSVEISDPSVCTSVFGQLETKHGNQTHTLPLDAPSILTGNDIWTLPAGTSLSANTVTSTWNVRFYDDAGTTVVINATNAQNTATVTFSE